MDPNEELGFALSFALGNEQLPSVAASGTYGTAVGRVVLRGNPEESELFELMSQRGAFRQMPPVGTRVVDRVGLELVRSWIEGL